MALNIKEERRLVCVQEKSAKVDNVSKRGNKQEIINCIESSFTTFNYEQILIRYSNQKGFNERNMLRVRDATNFVALLINLTTFVAEENTRLYKLFPNSFLEK